MYTVGSTCATSEVLRTSAGLTGASGAGDRVCAHRSTLVERENQLVRVRVRVRVSVRVRDRDRDRVRVRARLGLTVTQP